MDNRASENILSKVIASVIVVVIVGTLGFIGGMSYQKGKQATQIPANASPNGQGFGNFQGGQGSGRMNIVLGRVTAISSDSISVQDRRSDSTSTLEITSDTQVTDNGETASVSNIKVGDNVVVRPNSSNSKQAGQIMLNPQIPSGAAPSSTIN